MSFLVFFLTVPVEEIRAAQKNETLIRVVSPGLFETTSTTRKGSSATWLDLERYPSAKTSGKAIHP